MPDPIAPPAPAAAPADQRNAKSVANNIVNGIHNRANGSSTDKGQDGQQPPIAPPDPNAGKEKYDVDGKEVWLTPQQARAYVQKGIAFEPKVTQLGHLQNEMGQFLKTLSTDPLKILSDKRIGMTPEIVLDKIFANGNITDATKEKIGKWYYENVVAPLKMSPEERRLAELEKENEGYKSKEQQEADAKVRGENIQKIQAAMNQIKANIGEAMKESGLPSNDTPLGAEMARMVAEVMKLAHSNRQSITPKQAIEHVKSRIKGVQQAFYDHLDGEALVKELGEANAEKVKQYFLKLVKATGGSQQPPQNRQHSTPRGERKTINQDDFHEYLEELKKKG